MTKRRVHNQHTEQLKTPGTPRRNTHSEKNVCACLCLRITVCATLAQKLNLAHKSLDICKLNLTQVNDPVISRYYFSPQLVFTLEGNHRFDLRLSVGRSTKQLDSV